MNDSELIKNIVKTLELDMKEEIKRDTEHLIRKVDLLNKKAMIDKNLKLESYSKFLLSNLQLMLDFILEFFLTD